jgi:hypothetical protein
MRKLQDLRSKFIFGGFLQLSDNPSHHPYSSIIHPAAGWDIITKRLHDLQIDAIRVIGVDMMDRSR